MDSREAAKSKEIYRMLVNVLGQQVGVRKLDVGDYLLDGAEGIALVERKTITDLLNSMKPDETGRGRIWSCLLYTSPSPRDGLLSRMPSSA